MKLGLMFLRISLQFYVQMSMQTLFIYEMSTGELKPRTLWVWFMLFIDPEYLKSEFQSCLSTSQLDLPLRPLQSAFMAAITDIKFRAKHILNDVYSIDSAPEQVGMDACKVQNKLWTGKKVGSDVNKYSFVWIILRQHIFHVFQKVRSHRRVSGNSCCCFFIHALNKQN